MGSYSYPADNGSNYQLGTANDVLQAALGDLGANNPTDQVFPFTFLPRCFVLAIQPGSGTPTTAQSYSVACTVSNPLYLAGPGTVVSVGAVTYIVTRVQGEVLVDSR